MNYLGGGQPTAPAATGDAQQDAINQATYAQQMAELRRRQQAVANVQSDRVAGERSLADYVRQNDITKAGGGSALGGGLAGQLAATGLSEQDFIELIAKMKGSAV